MLQNSIEKAPRRLLPPRLLYLQSTCELCTSVGGGTRTGFAHGQAGIRRLLHCLACSFIIRKKKKKIALKKLKTFLFVTTPSASAVVRIVTTFKQVEQYRQGSNPIDLSALLEPATYYVAI